MCSLSGLKLRLCRRWFVPGDKEAVQRYLGLVTYLSKFIPMLSELTFPLREVCKKDKEFIWEVSQAEASDKTRQVVVHSPKLAYYDASALVVIQCDASAHALGTVLMQKGRPIKLVAKSSTDSQQNYSQIEKKFLAVVFACQRIRYYIVFRAGIKVETDHQPLFGLLKKEAENLTPRLARVCLELMSSPEIVLQYRPRKELVLANALSRSCPAGDGWC